MSAKTCGVVGVMSLVLFLSAAPLSAEPEPEMDEAKLEASVDSWDRLGVDEPRKRARAELAIFQLYHGLFFGYQSCSIFDCDDPDIVNLLAVSGAGIGLGGSFLVARDGITSGQARAINSGSLWGAWTGFASAGLLGDYSRPTILRTMMMTQAAGTAAGYLLSEQLRPTGGDVRLVNHAGFWSGIYYLAITDGILQIDQTDRSLATGLLVSTYLGAILGSQVAIERPMSAARVYLITVSGILGAHAGAAIAYSGESNNALNTRLTAATTLIGITTGLGVGAVLTRELDQDEPAYQRANMSFSMIPTNDGDGVIGSLSGHF